MAGADRVADVLSGLEVEDARRRRGLPALSIAAINSPRQTVVSGSANAIGRLASELAERRIRARLLPVAHAAHSPAMQAIAGEFGRVCETVAFRQPRVPVVSGVSGKLAGPEIARPDYWRRELCEPVRFADGIAALDEQGYRNIPGDRAAAEAAGPGAAVHAALGRAVAAELETRPPGLAGPAAESGEALRPGRENRLDRPPPRRSAPPPTAADLSFPAPAILDGRRQDREERGEGRGRNIRDDRPFALRLPALTPGQRRIWNGSWRS